MPDDEVDRLLFQADLRLVAARHLLKEGFYDDAVSRAYYSMYLPHQHYFWHEISISKPIGVSSPDLARSS